MYAKRIKILNAYRVMVIAIGKQKVFTILESKFFNFFMGR